MRYQVLLLNVPSDLHHALTHRLQGMDVDFTLVSSHQNVLHLCAEHPFHLVVLHFPDAALCNEFLIALRRVSYTPAIVLLDQYDTERACSALQAGADLCVGPEWPVNLAADHIMAQFRRFAAYTHDKSKHERDFQVGDIYIDPLRRVVRVKERSVRLRPREFELLLYFMRNQNIVLTPEQICEHAWGMEHTQSVCQSVHELRRQIEPNIRQSCYIKTVHRVGYQFMAHHSETCDD